MTDERLFIVTYDISNPKRWRRVFKAMHGYGEWLQLSVFQCRLTRRRRAELETRLRELIKNGEDHVLLIDVGPADKIELAVESIGKTFSKMERRAPVLSRTLINSLPIPKRGGGLNRRGSATDGCFRVAMCCEQLHTRSNLARLLKWWAV